MSVMNTDENNSARRRLVAAHPTLNGIDHLEVLDTGAPEGMPRQRTLLVSFYKPITGLSERNVIIEGGVRTNVQALWAFAAQEITSPPGSPLEQDFFGARPDADRLLVVRTDSAGDFSSYRLRLVSAPGEDVPPQGFDPRLSTVEFSFKVECPSFFDSQRPVRPPSERERASFIDYLAKDYTSFRRLMLDRLSLVLPDWRERSPADLGITLVELLAHAADHLSYYQDAVATEAYLKTARKRVSVRRHARLLDYPLHEGNNARVWVVLSVEAGSPSDGHTLPKQTALLAYMRTDRPALKPDEFEESLRQGAQVYETLHPFKLYASHNDIKFYTWSDDNFTLPRGATRATLVDPLNQRVRLKAGDVLIFEEQRGSSTGRFEDADPARRHAVRLKSVRPEASVSNDRGAREPGPPLKDPLTEEAIVEIEWFDEDALPFPLCISRRFEEDFFLDITVAHANVLLADHGYSLGFQGLEPDTVPTTGRYEPRFPARNITHCVPYDHPSSQLEAAARSLGQDPGRALPAVKMRSRGEQWTARRDLLTSGRFSLDFVMESDDDGIVRLRFGDGVSGKRPEAGARFEAACRVGNGAAGNVGTGAIAHIVTDQEGVSRVRNPMPAQGGTDPQDVEEVRSEAPQAFRKLQRAVTENDYAVLAGSHPWVQKAVARNRWTGSWSTVFVAIDRKGGRPVDAVFKSEIRRYLEPFRLAGTALEIVGPRFVPLDISMTVTVDPAAARTQIRALLMETFGSRELEGGGRGLFHPDHWTFGQPVYLSQLVAAAMKVPGVVSVDVDDTPPKTNRFQRWGRPPKGELAAGKISIGSLEIARLDNDPNHPENGRLEFKFAEMLSGL